MQFGLNDYNGILESATGKILHNGGSGPIVYFSRGSFTDPTSDAIGDEQDFQKHRPRVELFFNDEGGRGQFFYIPGVQPEAGNTPDRARIGSMSVTLITKPDYQTHSIFLNRVRSVFQTIMPLLNAALGGKYCFQNVIDETSAVEIKPQDGYFESVLTFKYRYSLNYQFDDGLSLARLRAAMPCDAPQGGGICPCTDPAAVSAVVVGAAGAVENLNLLISGWFESKGYTGGENDGAFFQIGGDPSSGTFNIARLTNSSSPVPYYLNRYFADSPAYLSYAVTIPAAVGDILTLELISVDAHELANLNGVEVPGVPGILPNQGQWLQIDLTNGRNPAFIEQTVTIE